MEEAHVIARMARRREELNLSQSALARAAELDASYINKIERQVKPVTLRLLQAVAPVLETSVRWLMFGDEGESEHTGVPLLGKVSAKGAVTGVSVPAALSGAALNFAGPPPTVWVADGAPGWFATSWGPEAAIKVTRDPGDDGARHWDLQPGDVIVWRPAGVEESPHDALVIVEMTPSDTLSEPRFEARVITRDRGEVVLHRVVAQQETTGDRPVVAVAVEQVRRVG